MKTLPKVRPLSDARSGQSDGPTELYLLFDAFEHLIYVGISLNAARRLSQHKRDKSWWCDVSRIDVRRFGTRTKALDDEKRIIQAWGPKHNIEHACPVTGRYPELMHGKPRFSQCDCGRYSDPCGVDHIDERVSAYWCEACDATWSEMTISDDDAPDGYYFVSATYRRCPEWEGPPKDFRGLRTESSWSKR